MQCRFMGESGQDYFLSRPDKSHKESEKPPGHSVNHKKGALCFEKTGRQLLSSFNSSPGQIQVVQRA
jgi:hypothetical protein